MKIKRYIRYCLQYIQPRVTHLNALSSYLQMTAYVLGVTYIVMDMGPGNGGLNRIAIMSSDAWFMPLCIDNEPLST